MSTAALQGGNDSPPETGAGNDGRDKALLVIFIMASGMLLRFLFLGRPSLWLDETYSIWVAKKHLNEICSFLAVHEPHPPLSYIILYMWLGFLNMLKIQQPPEWLLRIPYALASSLALVPFYFLSVRLLGRRLGLCALFMWAFASSEVIMAQEVRMYAFMGLFTSLSFLFYIRMRERGTFADAAAYCIFTALMLYTHYTGIFILAAQQADFLLSMRAGEWKKWLLSTAAVLLFFLPWMPGFLSQMMKNKIPPSITPIGLSVIPGTYVSLFYGFAANLKQGGILFWAALLLLSALVIRAFWKHREKQHVVLLGVAVLLPVIIMGLPAVFSTNFFFSPKHVILILPFLILLAVAGTRDWKGMLAVLLAAFILLNGLSLWRWYMEPEYQKQRWKEAVVLLDENREPGDLVVVMSPYQLFVYKYYEKADVPLYVPEAGWKEKDVLSAIGGFRRVWIFSSYGWVVDPGNRIGEIIMGRGKVIYGAKLNNRLDTAGSIGILLVEMNDAGIKKR